MTNRIKFLISLGNLIKTGGVKTVKQAMDFAEQQFGKLDKSFTDDIINVFKKEGKTKKGDVVPIKKKVDLSKYDDEALNRLVDEDIMLRGEADTLSDFGKDYGRVKEIEKRRKEIREILEAAQKNPELVGGAKEGIKGTLEAEQTLKKRTNDIMKEDIGEEKGILTLTDELKQKLKDYRKTQEEMGQSKGMFDDIFDAMIGFKRSEGSKDKTKPFKTPGMTFKKENPGYRLPGGSSYAEGNLRTAMREFLKTEVKEGRLKLNETDLFRITEYSPRSADDPIDVFRRYYGEAAMEAADKMAKKLEQGTSFKNYEEIFRTNMPQLKIKTQGAGLYDQSIIDAERVLKKAKDQEDYAKTLDEFDITDRTKNAHGGLIDVLKL